MTKITILQVPYDSGRRAAGCGRGPAYVFESGAIERLRAAGHDVSEATIEAQARPTTETGTAFELNGLLAGRVREASEAKRFPLVLAGNCMNALGALAGSPRRPLGLVWFDGHGDFNTPETSPSGFLDGMALAAATGRCWRQLSATIPGFVPVDESNVILVGARDFDEAERAAAEKSEIARIGAQEIDKLAGALDALGSRVEAVCVHVDMDVLDPAEAAVNRWPAAGGLTVEQLESAVRLIGERVPVAAALIASVDPEYDVDRKTQRACARMLQALVTSSHQGKTR